MFFKRPLASIQGLPSSVNSICSGILQIPDQLFPDMAFLDKMVWFRSADQQLCRSSADLLIGHSDHVKRPTEVSRRAR